MPADFSPRRRRWPVMLTLLACLVAAGPAAAEPALWVARSKTATVYLFGTVHALMPTMHWRSPKVTAAFKASQDLWLEVANPDDTAEMQPLVQRYGADPAHPLSTKLSKDQIARVDSAIRAVGGTSGEAPLEPLRPWLVAVMLVQGPLLEAGLDPASGVDFALKADAEAAGKPVRGLETNEQQIRFMATLPPQTEIDFLANVLDDVSAGPAKLQEMLGAWQAGDVAGLARLDLDMRDTSPTLYRTLFVNRNTAWANQIAERLKGTGTSFIAVGAGHLAGPDSVQVQLAKHGIEVKRD